MVDLILGVLAATFIALLTIMVLGFYFFKSSKQMPKTWSEWQTEFQIQACGAFGLYHDFVLRKKDRVELYKQPDRVAVITGGGRGIGLKIVEKLLECEMTVVMGVRNPKKAEASVAEIVDLSKTKGRLICEKLDVGSFASVREFAKSVQAKFSKIDILLNNAGIMFAPYELTEDGYESHFATNYLGHFLLTHLLLNQLKAAGKEGRNSRIVNVSSIVHLVGRINYNDINGSNNYYPATAYNQSKLAQVLFTKHLNNILREEGAHVQVHAVHPGVVDTDLFVHSSTTAVPGLKRIFFKTPEQGSRCVVYAAIAPKLEGKGGSYLSNCVRAKVHPATIDYQRCERLFKFSCDLLNIEKFGSVGK